MNSNPKNEATPSQPDNEDHANETLAQRSARLEAEATALMQAGDPLAPEPMQPESLHTAPAAETLKLQAELEATKDQMIRALAEAENTRRRAQKEREDIAKFAISGFAKDMLDVADNLRRALEAVPSDLLESDPRLKNLIEGIEVTERTLLQNFEKHGIRAIEPMGEIFNPNFHEVMFEAPAPGKPAGTIIQVMATGYTMHERLLRPARVGVVRDDGQGGGAPPSAGGHIDTQA
ncbi:MAG: nucleotide exchange factor GrpE [Alphaproteobacteria bacterium]|nr:nucleotide exchange factor GrpE [Alphaproteobacteria bacterium]